MAYHDVGICLQYGTLINQWGLYSEWEHLSLSLCGFMTDTFCHSLWQAALGQHLNTDNARQEPVGRRGNPTQCLSTNCVFAVFLLGAQYNKVPFAVYCSVFNVLCSCTEF